MIFFIFLFLKNFYKQKKIGKIHQDSEKSKNLFKMKKDSSLDYL